MRTLSEGFLAQGGRYYARLALSDGTQLDSGAIRTLTITASMNGAADRLTLGAAASATLTGVLAAPEVSLLHKRVAVYLGRMVSGELEEAALGVFTVTRAPVSGGQVTITAYDDMYAALERGYFPAVTPPTTARAVLADLADQAGLDLALPAGLADVPVAGGLEGYTMREMAGYMAALLGCSARIDGAGALRLGWYTPSGLTAGAEAVYSGGASLSDTDWTLGQLKCSVTTTATQSDTDGDGNTILTATEETVTLTAGDGPTGISLENPWMTQDNLEGIFRRIGGLRYRGGEISLLGDLRYEVGDIIAVDAGEAQAECFPIMAQTIEYDGGVKMTLSACAAGESGVDAASGPITQAVERFTAQLAVIKQIEAQNLTAVTARLSALTAETADLGSLKADKAEVEALYAARADLEALTARTAAIERAYVSQAAVDELLAGRATVEQLAAATAELDTLGADVANIQTLLAGSAGVGALQAIHLTGQNAVIDDAVITDAMIAGLSAGKISAGTLCTTLVKIASDGDENLLIDGATLQVRDSGGTLRVQIGRDAGGDYSYYLWDAEGNLLWSPTGVTGAGLNDGIIRDIAVAEDAGISGSKLNIASVAQRLSEDGSLTVDAAQVTVGDTTLAAAYQTLTQADAGLAGRTTALETGFSVVQGQISAKVWQSDITQALTPLGAQLTGLSDRYSALAQTVEGVQSTVGSVQTSVEHLRVGGRNLLEGTEEAVTYAVDSGNYVAAAYPLSRYFRDNIAQGDRLTLSFDWETTAESGTIWARWSYNSTMLYPGYLVQDVAELGPRGRYQVTFPVPDNVAAAAAELAASSGIQIRFRDMEGQSCTVSNVKLELGTVATSYTPAPEDVSGAISSTRTQISQAADSVLQQVSAAYATQDSLSQAQASLELSIGRKVGADELISAINAAADVITLDANRLVVNSTNFTLSSAGEMACKSGYIGAASSGWSIDRYGLTATGDSAHIDAGAWRIRTDYIHSYNGGAYVAYDGYRYHYGIQAVDPARVIDERATATNFLFVRRLAEADYQAGNTANRNWEYLFSVDYSGGISAASLAVDQAVIADKANLNELAGRGSGVLFSADYFYLGDTTATYYLRSSGAASLYTLTASNAATFNGTATFNSTLTCNASAHFGSSVTIGGHSSALGTVTSSGAPAAASVPDTATTTLATLALTAGTYLLVGQVVWASVSAARTCTLSLALSRVLSGDACQTTYCAANNTCRQNVSRVIAVGSDGLTVYLTGMSTVAGNVTSAEIDAVRIA